MDENNICELNSLAYTNTPTAIFNWATAVVRGARDILGSDGLSVSVWPYRKGLQQFLCCDISNALSNDIYDLTFVISGQHNFDLYNPSVPDMAEALHMAGIVIEGLNATARIGSRENELNPSILDKKYAGCSDGKMAVAGQY